MAMMKEDIGCVCVCVNVATISSAKHPTVVFAIITVITQWVCVCCRWGAGAGGEVALAIQRLPAGTQRVPAAATQTTQVSLHSYVTLPGSQTLWKTWKEGRGGNPGGKAGQRERMDNKMWESGEGNRRKSCYRLPCWLAASEWIVDSLEDSEAQWRDRRWRALWKRKRSQRPPTNGTTSTSSDIHHCGTPLFLLRRATEWNDCAPLA